jgi:hypothetical protein
MFAIRYAVRECCSGAAGSCQGPALASIAWASANSYCQGQAEAMAILTRRTLIRTQAPIFKSFSRIVLQVALANCVCASPLRRSAQSST